MLSFKCAFEGTGAPRINGKKRSDFPADDSEQDQEKG
jgi:hypothetical protein